MDRDGFETARDSNTIGTKTVMQDYINAANESYWKGRIRHDITADPPTIIEQSIKFNNDEEKCLSDYLATKTGTSLVERAWLGLKFKLGMTHMWKSDNGTIGNGCVHEYECYLFKSADNGYMRYYAFGTNMLKGWTWRSEKLGSCEWQVEMMNLVDTMIKTSRMRDLDEVPRCLARMSAGRLQ